MLGAKARSPGLWGGLQEQRSADDGRQQEVNADFDGARKELLKQIRYDISGAEEILNLTRTLSPKRAHTLLQGLLHSLILVKELQKCLNEQREITQEEKEVFFWKSRSKQQKQQKEQMVRHQVDKLKMKQIIRFLGDLSKKSKKRIAKREVMFRAAFLEATFGKSSTPYILQTPEKELDIQARCMSCRARLFLSITKGLHMSHCEVMRVTKDPVRCSHTKSLETCKCNTQRHARAAYSFISAHSN
ncbi:hypothetical protein GUITHDRAFT_135470 [Guillardia theta CCMP2712]|uniref:Uncharacterized protein n=1 Tax=Guillardia theta (strain CCMP2712) TaxID=905079 RepID=L1JQH1_GUITC|nr:hypothetical protein GUITHDRAFT_135470 [Guillardia theta CCMP2712]EKX50323.1 hypothetical protein GUITHDRAFT_135470 [Guillardia theta CCMP2712]|eukprot:XP_005837303.1 hypothetical protein GUITHDRAFT_135470 [Guillardia theta CCMP2712]